MSRSRKKTPIVGNTNAASEKLCKQKANRKLRKRAKLLLAGASPEEVAIGCLQLRSVSDAWTFGKDGKHWWDCAEAWRK